MKNIFSGSNKDSLYFPLFLYGGPKKKKKGKKGMRNEAAIVRLLLFFCRCRP